MLALCLAPHTRRDCRAWALALLRTAVVVLVSLISRGGDAAPAANYERPCQGEVKPAFLPLPPGAVEPSGWLRDWAVAAREGITGHLDERHPCFRDAWKGISVIVPGATADGAGWPLEQCAYWLDGAMRLGFVLHDQALIRKILRPARPHRRRRQ